MPTTRDDDTERSAAGMDYDFPLKEKASELGNAFATDGPEALFDAIENMLPESWREHIRAFPIAAVVLGVGAGVFLGMKKGDELIAAGTAMITAAAMENVTNVMHSVTNPGE
ncbi:MAG: hypothetical protein QOC81_2303 [Thermoanaerobaculia bacterium]|jgi:hypothetical protein|nr:hypothetical protein [Thermoanaerobaculia bacterium]